MQQPNIPVLAFRANILKEDGSLEPFSAAVSQPQGGDDDWFVVVRCDALRERPFSIYGVDAVQAIELGVKFLRLMLADVTLVGDRGAPVDIPLPDTSRFRTDEADE